MRLCPVQLIKMHFAFQCKLNKKLSTFGNIVRELTGDIQRAMKDNCIEEVSFKTIRYVWSWPYSEPGFYAGVNI